MRHVRGRLFDHGISAVTTRTHHAIIPEFNLKFCTHRCFTPQPSSTFHDDTWSDHCKYCCTDLARFQTFYRVPDGYYYYFYFFQNFGLNRKSACFRNDAFSFMSVVFSFSPEESSEFLTQS